MKSLFIVSVLLMSSVAAIAGPKEDALQIVQNWGKAFSDSDVNAIVNLYATDALMIGTAGKTVLKTPECIRKYFEGALLNNKPLTATLNTYEAMSLDDNNVVIAGFDTITAVREGQPLSFSGRVTFVVSKRGAEWKIVHLHRSPLPAQ